MTVYQKKVLIIYTNYLFDTYTTICSGFDNTCETKFKSLNINISFINEINIFKESFSTTVTVLKKSKIDLIISRETIKNMISLRDYLVILKHQ